MLLSLLATLALAQQGPTPAEAAMLACMSKPNDERLACFDQVAARLAEASLQRMEQGGAFAAAPVQPAPVAPSAPTADAAPAASRPGITGQAAAAASGKPIAPRRAAPVPGPAEPDSGAPGPAALDPGAPGRSRGPDARPREDAAADSRFGLPADEGGQDRLEAAINRIDFTLREDAVVTLADGQVWRQLSGDNRKLRERDARRAETAIIRRGAFGSYRMTIEPAGRTIRVRRER